MKQHDKADWITPDDPIFPPIVSPKLFEKVQAKIAALPLKKRSPKLAKLWLAGLIYCANCGRSMCGKKDTRTGKPLYICSTYVNARGPRKNCGCMCNTVHHDLIEGKLKDYLPEAGVQLADLIGGVKKAIAGKPTALKEAIGRAVEAHRKMRELVGAEFVRLSAGMTGGETVTVLELPDHDVGEGAVMFVPHWDTNRLEELYRDTFEDGRYDWENKLGELLAEQDKLFGRLDKIPATATTALGRVQAQLDQVDAKIRETKAKLENAAELFEEANAEYDRLNREWQEAQMVVETEASARRKAEAVRKVIAQINLTFRPTGRKRPVSELVAVEWVPVGAVSPRSQPESKSALERMPQSSSQRSGCPSSALILRALHRSYRQDMPDFTAIRQASVKASRQRYQEAHGDRIRAKSQRWRERNRKRSRDYARQYRQDHAEEVAVRERAYRDARKKKTHPPS